MKNKITIIIYLIFISSCSTIKWDLKNGKPLVDFNQVNPLLNSNLQLDTVFIKSGVYENLKFEILSVDRKVTFMPENPGEVTITGDSELIFKNCRNLKFEGFYFTKTINRDLITLDATSDMEICNNYFYHVGGFRFGRVIKIQNNSNNNKIFKNTFDDLKSMGVAVICSESLPVSNGNIITNNLFSNVKNTKFYYPGSDGNGLECIQIGQGNISTIHQETNTLISENTFKNIVGDRGEIISIKSSKTRIENNLFLNNDSAVTIRYGNYNVFIGNHMINTRAGLRIYGKGNEVINNTFFGGDFALVLPNTDYQNDQIIEVVGYYQQIENIIINNSIIYPKVSAFSIGAGKRKYAPENNTIQENLILIQSEDKNVEVGNSKVISSNSIRGNRTDIDKSIKLDSFKEIIQRKRGAEFTPENKK